MSQTKDVSALLKRTQFDKDLAIESEILENGEHQDAGCWDRFKKRIGQYCQALINYLQCDRLIPLADLQDEHHHKRFLEVFDESYSERSRRFAYTFEDVLEAKQKEEQQKEKTCWVEFKRLICCEGGNQMDEIDEKYIEDKDYEQIIRQERVERRKLMTQQEIQEVDPPETITPESVEEVEQLQEESSKSNSKPIEKPKEESEENSQHKSQYLKLVQVVPKEKPIDRTEESVFKELPISKDAKKTPSTSPSQETLHSNHTNITEENLLTQKVVTHYTKIIHRNVIEEQYIDQVKRHKRADKIDISEEEGEKGKKGDKGKAQTEQIQDENTKKKMKKERKRASQKQSDVPPLMMTQSKVELTSKEEPEYISGKDFPESIQTPSNNSRVGKAEVNQSIQNVEMRISSSITTVKQNPVEPNLEVKKKNSPEIPTDLERVSAKPRDPQTKRIKQVSASQETAVQLQLQPPTNLHFEEESKTTPVKTVKRVREHAIKVQQVSPQAFIFQEQQQIYCEKRATGHTSPPSQIVSPVPPQQSKATAENNQPKAIPLQNERIFERRELPTVQITESPNKIEKFEEQKAVQNAKKNRRTRPQHLQLPNEFIPEESIQSQPISAVDSIPKRRNKMTIEQNEPTQDPKFSVAIDSERFNTIDLAPETYVKKRRQRQINHHEEQGQEIIIHEQAGQYKRASTTANLSNKKSLPAPSPIVPQVQLIASRIEKKRRKIQMKQEVDIEEEIDIEDI